MNRRAFLQTGLGVGGLLLFGNLATLAAGHSPDRRMLVAIHLGGGNDGLNTVVPWKDVRYRQARPQLALRDHELWLPGGPLAMHDALSALRPCWEAGHLAVVNGVGYPQPVRSHFKSADVWQSGTVASAPMATGAGWMGRALDLNGGVGMSLDTPLNRSLWSTRQVSLAVGPAFKLDRDDELAWSALDSLYRSAGAPSHLRSTWDNMQRALDIVHRRPAVSVRLPATEPGKALGTLLAFLPAADMYHVTLGGFDTHSHQRARHAKVWRETATALAAFWQAVESQGLAERTVVLVYSEFGRRVEENASGGTDHGAAGPVFLLGRHVKGGWYGEYPSLAALEDGDLAHGVDFRQVYASVLEGWLGQRSQPILGETFSTLPLWT